METTVEKNQFVKRLLIICVVITLIILAVIGISYVINILMLVFAAVLLSIFLRGLADLLNRYMRLSETLSVLIVSVILIAIIAGAIASLAPSVAEQVRHLRAELPSSIRKVSEYISQFGWGRAIIEQMPDSTNDVTKIINPWQLYFQRRRHFFEHDGRDRQLFYCHIAI